MKKVKKKWKVGTNYIRLPKFYLFYKKNNLKIKKKFNIFKKIQKMAEEGIFGIFEVRIKTLKMKCPVSKNN